MIEQRAGLDIARQLAEQDPHWQVDLSTSHERIGDVLLDQRDLAASLREYRASLDIRQRMADKDPESAQWQRGLMFSYTRIGLFAYRTNDFPAALDAFEKAEKIALHVREIDPTAASSATDLASVQSQLEETRRKIAGSPGTESHK